MKRALWHLHPHVDNDLQLGDRVADRLRNLMASWPFIIGSLVYMGAWILVAKLRLAPVDNPQLTYLNLILSCAAALSSSIILLSQKRSDVIASEVALHTEGNTTELVSLNRQQIEILRRLDGLDGTVGNLADVVQQVLAAREEHGSAVLAEAKAARQSAEAAFAGVKALAAVAAPSAVQPQPLPEVPPMAPGGPGTSGMGSRTPKGKRGM